MTPVGGDRKEPTADATAHATPGEKAFAVFDFAITVVKVTVVVLGVMIVIIALSGVEMSSLDEHEVFRHRVYAAPVVIVGYLLIDYLIRRRRVRGATYTATRGGAVNAGTEFVLSIDSDADSARRATEAVAMSEADQARPKRGYSAEFISLGLVAAGGAAFWHDHINNELPNPVAVVGKFVSAQCIERLRSGSRIGVVIGPHMSIGYEFPSQSTSVRVPTMQCFLDSCGPEKAPQQYLDTEYNRVFYAFFADCKAALPAVLAAKAATTVWTGDKDPNASVRARFTPERATPPYFLLWIPLMIAAVVLLISGFTRGRRARGR